jgi:hypothetical protein
MLKQTAIALMLVLVLFASCDLKSKPYLKHDIEYEKVGADCSQDDDNVSVDANIIGERYVFTECLNSSFKGECVVERKGDTVEVKLGEPSTAKSLFKITLDINTRPAYHFLTINGNTIGVNVARD